MKGKWERGWREEGAGGVMERRLREIEKGIEMRERKKRKRNTIFRNVVVKEGKERDTVEGLIKETGEEERIEEIKRIETREAGKDLWWVRLGSEEQKRELMRRKSGLKGRKERMDDDLTVMERKIG